MARLLVVAVVSGAAMAGLYASASVALGPLSPVRLPVWGMVVGMVLVATLGTLALVDLKRSLIGVVLASAVCAVVTWASLAYPGVVLVAYAVRLSNYGWTQAVLALLLAFLSGLVGVLVGAVVNSGVRGLEV